MKYFKVKKEYDDSRIYIRTNLGMLPTVNLVANELYTPREKERLHIPDRMVEQVEVSRKQIYFLFGARFENGTSYSD